MKKQIIGVILFAASTTTGWAQSGVYTHRLLITPQTSKHSLDSVSAAWKKDSITLTFPTLQYSSTGKLVKIKGSIVAIYKGKMAMAKFSSDNLVSYKVEADPGVSVSGK